MKTTFRISFNEKEGENLQYLLDVRGISKPQDFIRQLITEAAVEQRKFDMRYGSKSKGKPRTSKKERRAAIEALPDDEFYEAIKPHLDREFRKGPEDSIWIEKNITGQRMVHYVRDIGTTGQDKWEAPVDYYLNQWEREGRL